MGVSSDNTVIFAFILGWLQESDTSDLSNISVKLEDNIYNFKVSFTNGLDFEFHLLKLSNYKIVPVQRGI